MAARFVCQTLAGAGHLAVVVGGCVRDCLLGREPNDWDVATSAMPDDVLKLFSRVIPTGLKHGTVTVLVKGEQIEVTTFRSDGAYSDGRRPDSVRLGVNLQEDLSRRDFTMNAMAFDPHGDRLFDPFHGAEDLKKGLIRCVGRAEDRFNEDGLRMMRAIRFMATLDMGLTPETITAIESCLPTLHGCSGERIRMELVKLLGAQKPSTALRLAMDTKLLTEFIPELRQSVRHPQNQWHKFDVWEHTLATVDATKGDAICRVAALLHDIGKPFTAKPAYGPGQFSFIGHEEAGAEIAADTVETLKFSNEERGRIVGMVRHHMALFGFGPKTTKKAIRKIIKKVGHMLPDIVILTEADIVGKGDDPAVRLPNVRERLWEVMSEIASGAAAVSTNQLAINGRDVMTTLAIKGGPEVGKVLAALLSRVMDEPELNNREALIGLIPEVSTQ